MFSVRAGDPAILPLVATESMAFLKCVKEVLFGLQTLQMIHWKLMRTYECSPDLDKACELQLHAARYLLRAMMEFNALIQISK